MPAKIYLQSPPFGDFRAMPARGGGVALLKWITSFPGNPERGLPTVMGVICLSDAQTGAPLMLLDARAVTALRTGAVAAVATQALAAEGAESVGIIGCGLHGAWTGRCLAASGYTAGVCFDPRADVAAALAGELGWSVGPRAEAVRCDVVCCVTPGAEVVIDAGDLRAGMHLNMLGADGPGKAEATRRRRGLVRAVLRRVGTGVAWRRADRRRAGGAGGARSGDGAGRGARRGGAGAAGRGGGDAVRLHRPGHPGPRDRARGL